MNAYEQIIDAEVDTWKLYPVQPHHIKKESIGNFQGDTETARSVYWVVALCQKKNGWFPFTYKEINALYKEINPGSEFDFRGLISRQATIFWSMETYPLNFIVMGDDRRFRVSHKFIAELFTTAPNIQRD